jgi:hypothetical protein
MVATILKYCPKESELIGVDQNQLESIRVDHSRSQSIRVDRSQSVSIRVDQSQSEPIRVDRSQNIKNVSMCIEVVTACTIWYILGS